MGRSSTARAVYNNNKTENAQTERNGRINYV